MSQPIATDFGRVCERMNLRVKVKKKNRIMVVDREGVASQVEVEMNGERF